MERRSDVVINYDRFLSRYPYKYAVPVAVAKRARDINDFAKPFVESDVEDPVIVAFKEMELGYVGIRNEEILKALVPKVK